MIKTSLKLSRAQPAPEPAAQPAPEPTPAPAPQSTDPAGIHPDHPLAVMSLRQALSLASLLKVTAAEMLQSLRTVQAISAADLERACAHLAPPPSPQAEQLSFDETIGYQPPQTED